MVDPYLPPAADLATRGHTFVLFNAGGPDGFYHVERNSSGVIVHVAPRCRTLAVAIAQAVAAGAATPIPVVAHPHDKEAA